MCNRLGIGCDPVMLLVGEMGNFTLEATQDLLYERQLFWGSAVVDYNERLTSGRNRRSVHRVAGDDINVFR